MKLRIISGELKRRYITVPADSQDFRPTLERKRQAVAEILKPVVPGSIAADVCAGSGAFGFEMVSRGAATVHFVENNKNRAAIINQHAEKFKVKNRCTIFCTDVHSFIGSCRTQYNIIFYDPPYHDTGLLELAPCVMALLAPGGTFVLEREKKRAKQIDLPSGITLVDEREYGPTVMQFFKRS